MSGREERILRYIIVGIIFIFSGLKIVTGEYGLLLILIGIVLLLAGIIKIFF